MPALEHPSPADLEAFAIGTLPDDAARAVESHLAECPECLSVAAAAPDDTLVTLLRSAETSQAGPVTPGSAYAETVGLSQADTALPASRPAALADHPKYRLIRPLGRGGMGHVWLAEHTLMNRTVALKLVRPEFLDRPEAVERFRREVRAAARLNHPNIVAAHDAEQAGGTHFLIMEYIDGKTLAERIEAGPVPIQDACQWIIDAARGLDHARTSGLIHRDVKPHNLILERATGRVKVLDFGLAGVAAGERSGLTGGNVVIGTPDYIAPEQAEDARTADTRSDVYSLGCTLYHLLAGRPPFAGESVLKKLDAHRTQVPERLDAVRQDMTPALAELVARMLAKDPADRPQTPGEVAVSLEEILAGRGGEPPTPARRPKRGRRPRPWRVLVVTAAAALLAFFLGSRAFEYFFLNHGKLILEPEADDVVVAIKQDGELVRQVHTKTDRSVTLPTGSYDLELVGAEGFRLDAERVEVRRGEPVVARVERVETQPLAPVPTPVTLVGKPDARWTDLLPYVDITTDRERGELVRVEHEGKGVLRVKDPGGFARVRLPLIPAGDYEIRTRITRVEGRDSFNLMLPVPTSDGRTQAGLYIDGFPRGGGLTGLEWPNGPQVHMEKTELRARLVNDRPYDVVVRVSSTSGRVTFHVAVNEIPIFNWTGRVTDVQSGVNFFTNDRRHLGFGVCQGAFRVDRFDMRMLSGKGTFSIPGAAPSNPPDGPQELVGRPDAPWTDLLAGLSIPANRIAGTWGIQGGIQSTSLVAGSTKDPRGRLALPVWPKGDYEVRIRFARTAGDDCLALMLPVGQVGAQTALVIDSSMNQVGWVGFEYVNKKLAGTPIKEALGQRLANDTPYTLHVRVQVKDDRASIRATLDGKKIAEWRGEIATLTPSANWSTTDRAQLGLGVWDKCQFRIDALDFRPLNGTAVWMVGASARR